jgi:hypothetical protein
MYKPKTIQEINALIADYAGVPRPFTDQEWAELTGDNAFPNLQRESCWRLRAASYSGNCVAYTLGDLSEYEFLPHLNEMIEFYKGHGYEQVTTRSEEATIDLWVAQTGTFSHASRRYTGTYMIHMPPSLWESFPLPMETFTHRRFDIQNDYPFFQVRASLRRSASGRTKEEALSSSSSSISKYDKKKSRKG